MPDRRRRIRLALDLTTHHMREILRGIMQYASGRLDWEFRLKGWGDIHDQQPAEAFDGMIGAMSTTDGLPPEHRNRVVNVATSGRTDLFPSVHPDDALCGRMVADHFIERGFRHFACCGDPDRKFTRLRHEAFATCIEQAGHTCRFFTVRGYTTDSEQQRESVREWLKACPQPLAVFASNDLAARRVIDAASDAGLPIPQRVAVVGVDNDVLLCELTRPPLSSVDLASARIGYESAELLDRMFQGEPAPTASIRIPPAGLVTRASSDALAIDDDDVVAALRWIDQHACRGKTVEDLVAAIPLSRRALEVRFRRATGQTPGEYIRQFRIRRAKSLLNSTELPVAQIAAMAGFTRSNQFSASFVHATGMTASEFRRVSRLA